MREVAKNKHQTLWIEAVDAKFEGAGKPWGRDEFERILAGYEVRLCCLLSCSRLLRINRQDFATGPCRLPCRYLSGRAGSCISGGSHNSVVPVRRQVVRLDGVDVGTPAKDENAR